MNDTTSPRPFCFVLMPFSSEFDDIYNLGIKDACKEAGTYCERVDEQIFNESILDRVFNQIAKADVVIADMTGKNPNVFYEVGYAHALGKTTILLTQRTEDIPFDLKHFPHIVYNSRITFLKEELKKRLAWFITHPTEKPEEKLDIDIFIGQRNLSAEKVTVTGSYTAENYGAIILNFVFHNKSSFTFASGDFKVGIL